MEAPPSFEDEEFNKEYCTYISISDILKQPHSVQVRRMIRFQCIGLVRFVSAQ